MDNSQNPIEGAPPVIGGGSVPPREREGQPWTWIAFGALVLFLFAMMMVAYFGVGQPEPEEEPQASIGAETKLVLKGLAVQMAAEKMQGRETTPEGAAAIKRSLLPIQEEAEEIADESLEGARYLVVTQKLRGAELDADAIAYLNSSKSETDLAVVRAVQGDTTAVEQLDQRSDDWSERFAYALAAEAGGDSDARGEVVSMQTVALFGIMTFGGILVIGGGVIAIVGYFVFQMQKPTPAIGYPSYRVGKFSADMSALKATIYLLFYFFVAQMIVGGISMFVGLDMGLSTLLAMLVGLVFLLVMMKLPFFGEAPDWGTIMGVKGNFWKHLGAGVLAYMANFPIFLTLTLISSNVFAGLPAPSHGIAEQLMGDVTIWTVLALGISAAIIAPITEEIVFRGWVFRGLLERTGKVWLSILICGISFSIIHPQGPIIYPALAAIGAMGAFVTYRTGSLVPAMIMHGLHNGTILLVGQVLLK